MDKYAVIGNPVEHSLSPVIFEAFASQTQKKFLYTKIKAPLDGFIETVRQFQQEGGNGLNVTLPFKREAYQFANQRSEAAEIAKAASVLHFRSQKIIYADNFDGFGLVQDLMHNHHIVLQKKKILLVGAGGAAQGILGALLKQAPAQVVIANRTKSRALELASSFRSLGPVVGDGFSELASLPYDIIIHATSLGHQGKAPDLPAGLIAQNTCCYDLSYGKAAEPFLHWARAQGATLCTDGLGMLVEHNAATFQLWFGILPDTKPVLKMLHQRRAH